MTQFLLDTSVLLDFFNSTPNLGGWAELTLLGAHQEGELLINPIIYAELAPNFRDGEELDDALSSNSILKALLPYEAAFRASEAFLKYRKLGGSKTSPLPDFYIGAHAAVEGLTLITRDSARFKTYFPDLHLISPDSAA